MEPEDPTKLFWHELRLTRQAMQLYRQILRCPEFPWWRLRQRFPARWRS